MSVVSMPAARIAPESELEQIVQLAVTLSGRMARLHLDNIGAAIAEALGQIARATRVDGCQLLEFTESGSVARTHLAAGTTGSDDDRTGALAQEDWLVGRLSRGEAVSISRPDELPDDATAARELARRSGGCSILGVPASVAGQVVCALVLDSAKAARRWPQPLVERLQLLSEILGAGAAARPPRERAARQRRR